MVPSCFAPNLWTRLFCELNEAELRISHAVVEMHEVFRELLVDHLQGRGPQLPRSPVKLGTPAARQESRAWRNVRRNIKKRKSAHKISQVRSPLCH